MTSTGYIVIPKWREFQHYRNRDPVWVKVYRDLLRKDQYLNLSHAQRGLLLDLWLLVAEFGDGRVSDDRVFLAKRLNVARVDLEPLIQAGFIRVRASKSRAERKQNGAPEKEKPTVSKEGKRRASAAAKSAAHHAPKEDPENGALAAPDQAARAAALKADLAKAIATRSEPLTGA